MEISEINKLGKELELYTTVDYIGKGFPIILPRGAKMIEIIKDYIEEKEEKNGYKIVRTPSVSRSEIYKIEDRFNEEKDEIFIIKKDENEEKAEGEDENSIVLRPYVQPFHCSIYQTKKHTYKELPIKYSETSMVFRNERDIKGITKTRQITLSDASVFSDATKIQKDIKDAILLQKQFIDEINLDVCYNIATWDNNKKEEYIGNVDEWDNVTSAMKNVLDELKIKYTENRNARMYGPAIQILYNGRDFSSLQIDFEITHRFDLKYTDKDNKEKFPIYMHMTLVGSYENLLSILIEKYNGDFPKWIAPTQVVLINDGEEFDDYTKQIKDELEKNKIRTDMDTSMGNVESKKNRAIELQIPYIVIIEKEELKNNRIRVISKDDTKEEEDQDAILDYNKDANKEKNKETKYKIQNYKIEEFIKEVLV